MRFRFFAKTLLLLGDKHSGITMYHRTFAVWWIRMPEKGIGFSIKVLDKRDVFIYISMVRGCSLSRKAGMSKYPDRLEG